MKSNEVGTIVKHPKTINDNVKNLSKRMEMKDKGECHLSMKDKGECHVSLLLGEVKLQGYADSDWVESAVHRKSTS
jgi:hypothetical protein